MIANSLHRTVTLSLCGLLIFVSFAWANPYKTSKVFTVTSAGSSRNEVGTLNWAVFQADYFGADVNLITFNIQNLTPQTEIVLSETLYIDRLMVLDATTQPGYKGQPLIHINAHNLDSAFLIGSASVIPPYSDGSPATGGGNPGIPGVRGASAGSTIQGFQIFGFKTNGVTILKEAEGNFIQYNWIGFKPTAQPGVFLHNTDMYPNSVGVGIASNFNSIRYNTISGVSNGINIGESGDRSYVTNSVKYNYIGTDPTGSFKIGNTSDGIFLGNGAQQNFIGPGNVLSGQASAGCELLAASVTGNLIFGNIIGLNAAGDAAIPNNTGVFVANGAYFNEVGSGNPQNGNVISGNTLGGVVIGQPGFLPVNHRWGTWVENNLIGTDKTGTKIIGGQRTGVTVQYGSEYITVRFNVLAGHSNHGAAVVSNSTGSVTSHNGLFGNWIGRNQNGTLMPNQGYGVWLSNASHNFIGIGRQTPNPPYFVANQFGTNLLGPVSPCSTCIGNVIDGQ
jgi:hypothetical protein